MSTLNCNFTPPATPVQKKKLTETREEQLKKRAKLFSQRTVMVNPTAEAVKAARKLEVEKLISHRVIDLQDFTGHNPNKFAAWTAEWLGQFVGKEGKLSKSLFENKRRTANLMRMIGHNYAHGSVADMNKQFKQLAKLRGVDKDLHGKLMTDLFEVGSTRYDLDAFNGSAQVEDLLRQRNEKFNRDMLQAGFTQDDIDGLALQANKASEAFKDIRQYLEEVGYKIEDIENIGYFPRIMTSDAESYFRVKKYFDQPTKDLVVGTSEYAAFAKKRNTHWYTLDDHKTLQDLLGVDDATLNDMLLDTASLKTHIEEMVNDETLDLLVDSGIMSRVPMTSSELFEWYSTKYELPFSSFDDVFISNPKKVLDGYVNELEDAAANFGIANSLKEQGAVKGLLFDTPPSQDYVPVSSLVSGDLLGTGGVKGYVHKEVGRLIDAAVGIERNPAAMHGLSMAWRQMQSILKTQLLTSAQYVSRIFFSNAMQYALHGGEVHSLVSSIWDMGKYLSRGIKSFDDTVPYRVIDGRTYTHRAFIQEFVGARLNNLVPIVDGLKRGEGDLSSLNPLLIPKKVGLIAKMVNEGGVGLLPMEAIKQYKKFSATLFQPLGFAANYMDLSFKLGLVKSVTKTGTSWDGLRQGARMITMGEGAAYDTFQQALDHADRAYLSYDNIGKAPAYVSQNLIPFFAFTFQSASAIMRDAARNPVKYMVYGRVFSLINDRIEEQQDNPIEASLPPWLREDVPFVLHKDENGNYITLSLSNVHPLFGFGADLNKYGKLLGIRNDGEDDYKAAMERVGAGQDPKTKLSEWFNETYYGDAVNALFNQRRSKPDASRPNTYLGVEMPQYMEALIKYLAPIGSYVNRQNPGQVFGSMEIRSGNELQRALGQDEVIRQEERAALTGTKRSDYDNVDLVSRVNPALGVAAKLGFNATYVEGQKNTQKTLSSIGVDLSRLKGMRKDYARAVVENGNDVDKARLQQIDQLIIDVELAKEKLEQYMVKNGITTEDMDRKLKDGRLTIKYIMEKQNGN